MTDRIEDTDTTTGKPSGPAGPVTAAEAPRQFGLAAAMALIVGSIIGVGIFNLPTSLAGYGPITLISMALTTVGALALAIMFASLSRRLPADGGPYAYARVAFDRGPRPADRVTRGGWWPSAAKAPTWWCSARNCRRSERRRRPAGRQP